jgi:hypothetical protein
MEKIKVSKITFQKDTKTYLNQQHILYFLAFQYADGTDEFTIRKSFQWIDGNTERQEEFDDLFGVSYSFVKLACQKYIDFDKVYKPASLS